MISSLQEKFFSVHSKIAEQLMRQSQDRFMFFSENLSSQELDNFFKQLNVSWKRLEDVKQNENLENVVIVTDFRNFLHFLPQITPDDFQFLVLDKLPEIDREIDESLFERLFKYLDKPNFDYSLYEKMAYTFLPKKLRRYFMKIGIFMTVNKDRQHAYDLLKLLTVDQGKLDVFSFNSMKFLGADDQSLMDWLIKIFYSMLSEKFSISLQVIQELRNWAESKGNMDWLIRAIDKFYNKDIKGAKEEFISHDKNKEFWKDIEKASKLETYGDSVTLETYRFLRYVSDKIVNFAVSLNSADLADELIDRFFGTCFLKLRVSAVYGLTKYDLFYGGYEAFKYFLQNNYYKQMFRYGIYAFSYGIQLGEISRIRKLLNILNFRIEDNDKKNNIELLFARSSYVREVYNDLQSASEILLKVFNESKNFDNKNFFASAGNLIQYYVYMGQYDKASDIAQVAEKYFHDKNFTVKETLEFREELALYFLSYAIMLYKKEEYQKAWEMIEQSIKRLRRKDDLFSYVYRLRAQIARILGYSPHYSDDDEDFDDDFYDFLDEIDWD